jgi:glutathione S-transferase
MQGDNRMKPLLVVGSYLSPYVRKVLVCLEAKGIAYEVDHIVPFFGDDRFSRLSPLRRIPVLVDGDLVLSDSSVICQYLEDLAPSPALFPADIRDRARARWLEEFADTRMGDVFIWRYFNQVAIRPSVWGEKGDRDLVERTLKEEVPTVLDYLEAEAPAEDFRFGAFSIADIAPACFFRTVAFVRFQIDAARWPRTAAWMGRTLASAPFQKLAKIEDAVLRVPVPQQREALQAMGAPVSRETYAAASPRRGIMPI